MDWVRHSWDLLQPHLFHHRSKPAPGLEFETSTVSLFREGSFEPHLIHRYTSLLTQGCLCCRARSSNAFPSGVLRSLLPRLIGGLVLAGHPGKLQERISLGHFRTQVEGEGMQRQAKLCHRFAEPCRFTLIQPFLARYLQGTLLYVYRQQAAPQMSEPAGFTHRPRICLPASSSGLAPLY